MCDNPVNTNYRCILIITQLKRADSSISHLENLHLFTSRFDIKNDFKVKSKTIAILEQKKLV